MLPHHKTKVLQQHNPESYQKLELLAHLPIQVEHLGLQPGYGMAVQTVDEGSRPAFVPLGVFFQTLPDIPLGVEPGRFIPWYVQIHHLEDLDGGVHLLERKHL